MQSFKCLIFAAIFSVIGCGFIIYHGFSGTLISGIKSTLYYKQPKGLVSKENVYDFGPILPDEANKCEHMFTLKNTCDQSIKIMKYSSSCGCTVLNIPKKAILPGQTVEVLVTAHLGSKFGKREVVVSLETDNPDNPELLLKIKAQIDAPVALSQDVLYCGNLQPGEQNTRTVKLLKRNKSQQIRLLKITNNSKNVSISHIDNDNMIGNIPISEQGEEFKITVTGSNAKGEEATTIVFHTDLMEFPELKLSILAQYEGIIKAIPNMLIFRTESDIGEDIKIIRITTKRNNNTPKCELVSQYSSNPFSIEKIKTMLESDQSTTFVSVKCDWENVKEENRRSILRVTNDTQKLNIPIVAFVKRQEN
jgi:hypothetical protein